jgi:hypothetical protein
MRRHFIAATLFVAASVAMTWPLARLIDRAVADPGDPFINVWILDWDHYATFHSPLALFDANAFHPARYSLAFSENLYGIALFLIPFRLAGVPPITAYNVAMLAGFAFSGFGAYLLAQRLTASFPAALAAGMFYAFVPFRFTHLAHLQHVWGGWMPLLLVALIAYIDRPGWRRAALFGMVFLLNGLTNIHWFLFGSFATAAAAAVFWWSGVRRWRELVVCTAIALALFSPFLYPYAAAAKLYGMVRSAAEAKYFSAMLTDWFVSSDRIHQYAFLRNNDLDPERWLFPGILALLLSAAGIFAIRRSPRPVVFGLLWVAIGVAGSLGLNFFFHDFLYEAVPGFKAVRAPARWAAIAYIGMSMLMAAAVSWIGIRSRWVTYALIPLLLFELRAAPIRWYLTAPDAPPVYKWLATEVVSGPIVELPINYVGSEYRYLLRATEHHEALVNGVSGFTPPLTARLTAMSKANPIPEDFLGELRKINTKLVIVHADQLGDFSPATRDWLRREIANRRLAFVRRFDSGIRGDWVFSLNASTKKSSPELEAFLSDQWTRSESTFGFMEPVPERIRGSARFSGWAMSPYGIRKVDLLFGNGAVPVPTALVEDQRLSAAFHWYPETARPRFVVELPRRPDGLTSSKTDVQAEVTDGRGHVIHLENLWFEWE